MSNYGNPPSDPYGQPDPSGQPYGQDPYGQQAGQGAPVGYAHWGKRVVSYLIDGLLTSLAQILYVVGAVMMGASTETTTDPVTGRVTTTGDASPAALALMGLGLVMGIAFFIWNTCIKQGRTGYSIGKGVMGIKLIKLETGQPVGAGMAFVRQIAHVLDSLPCMLGYLWPLWDAKRQTFADKVMGTVVIDQPKG